jgi:hypothetical protein
MAPFDWKPPKKKYQPRGVDLPDINSKPKKPSPYSDINKDGERHTAGKNPGKPKKLDDIVKDGERHTAGQTRLANSVLARQYGSGSGGSSSGGGGLSGGGSAALAGPMVDPLATGNSQIDALYAKLVESLQGSNTNTAALHDAAKEAIKKQFGSSADTMYNTYMGSRDTVNKNAQGLGIDLNTTKIGQEYDANLRGIADLSNLQKDSNLAYVDKMKALRGSQFENLLAEAETAKVSRKNALALELMQAAMQGGSGGGGGGGKSGGGKGKGKGSSSGSTTLDASESNTINNVGDVEAFNSLQGNPAAQAMFDKFYRGSGLDVTKAISDIQAYIGSKSKKKTTGFLPGLQNYVNKTRSAQALAAQQALVKISGAYGNQATTNKTSTKGKKKI